MNIENNILNIVNDNLMSEREKKLAIIEFIEMQIFESIPQLLAMLQEKSNIWCVRDGIALGISEIKIDEAVPILIDLIKKADYNDRGTLLYSLINLDCKKYFLFFIKIICTGNFECRQMCFFIIEKYTNEIDQSIRKRALNILKFYKKQHETIKKYNKYLPDTILGIKSAQRVLYTKKPQ